MKTMSKTINYLVIVYWPVAIVLRHSSGPTEEGLRYSILMVKTSRLDALSDIPL